MRRSSEKRGGTSAWTAAATAGSATIAAKATRSVAVRRFTSWSRRARPFLGAFRIALAGHYKRHHDGEARSHKRATLRHDYGRMPTRRTIRRRQIQLRAAEAAIQRRYGELDLAIADIAANVGCSTRQLQRIFREEAREDFRSYLLRIRMTRARELLARESSPLPIRTVAPMVGYRRPSGLRQAFRRYWGVNPSEVQPDPPQELWYQVDDPAWRET